MDRRSAPSPTSERSWKMPAVIALVAIAVGAALRIAEYARNRPLWLDEAMLALNIASRPLSQLARPLDYDQAAPLLYLWIERLFVRAAGAHEWTLRLLPFIAGLALLPLTWFAVRRAASSATAAIVTVLVAVSVSLVSFSAEAKQYGVDPVATMVVVWLAARVAATPNDGTTWRDLALGGLAALLLSQPAVFVLGGAGLALGLDGTVRRAPGSMRRAALTAGAWAALFLALYIGFYRTTATSAYMRRFWEGTFLDPRTPDFLLRLKVFALAALAGPTLQGDGLLPVWAFVCLWLAGLTTLWRRRRFAGALSAAPLVLAALASGLGLYAVMDRLFLFAAPLVLLSYASLLQTVAEAVPARRASAVLVAMSVAVAAIVAPTHAQRVRHPVFYAVGKQVIADVDRMSHGEPVYVAARSFPLWVYYTTDWAAPDVARLRWAASIGGAGAIAHNNAASRGHARLDDARALTRRYHGRTEIVGLPTGRQYRTSTRTLNPALAPTDYALPLRPDSGWAELEVSRMASAAEPRLWVFGSHMFSLDGAEPGLVAELQRRSVRLVQERRQGSTVAYQVEFPSEP